MENKETKNYDEWPKNDFDGIERLKYRIKKNHASNESENGSDSLDILINAFKEIAKEIASEPSSDEKKKKHHCIRPRKRIMRISSKVLIPMEI